MTDFTQELFRSILDGWNMYIDSEIKKDNPNAFLMIRIDEDEYIKLANIALNTVFDSIRLLLEEGNK